MDTENQIAVVKEQATKALDVANSLTVDTDEQMFEAGNVLKRVKIVGKMIKDRKEEITKPMNDALKSVRSLFKPIEEYQEKAQDIVSEKMLSYQRKQSEIAEKVRLENVAKLNNESNANDVHMYDDMQVVPEVVKKSEDFHTRTVAKMRIVDINKIPDEYWIIDEVKLRKDVVSGKVVDGAEYYEESIIV